MPRAKIKTLHFAYLDASAAVKLVVPIEKGRQKLLSYFQRNFGGCYMTAFCLHETLTALKTKWKRGESTKLIYLNRCYDLLSYVRNKRISLDSDFDLADFEIFSQVEAIVEKYDIDISDALQVVTIKHGRFKGLAQESQTVFVSADNDLLKAAKLEGLRVWDLLHDDPPE